MEGIVEELTELSIPRRGESSVSEAAEHIRKRQEAERQRLEAEAETTLQAMGRKLQPLARRAADNMRRIGYPPVRGMELRIIPSPDGGERVTWLLARGPVLTEDGTLTGLRANHDADLISKQLRWIASYRVPGPFRKWMEGQGIVAPICLPGSLS